MKNKSIGILIIEDDETVRINLEAYLQDEGFDVISSSSGEDALEQLKKRKVDVAIIDMRLPNMDGNILILEINKLFPETKFIIHTGSMGYRLPESLINLGISNEYVFKKPIKNMYELVLAINRLILKKH